jgi:CheY-like chemotaxis protein
MKQRILVIDDDRLVADTLSLVFAANGFEAEARYSAAAGMERARSFGPELVLCDVTMPEENGLQFADKLRRELPAIPVLMLTAFASNAAKVDAHATRTGHPLRLLNKPCRPEDLLRECSSLLKTA